MVPTRSLSVPPVTARGFVSTALVSAATSALGLVVALRRFVPSVVAVLAPDCGWNQQRRD